MQNAASRELNRSADPMEICFYGVRGSLPAPATGVDVQRQIAEVLVAASEAGVRFETSAEAEKWLVETLPFHKRSHYGGDTTCFLVRCGDIRIAIDAGSGIRRLGKDLFGELLRDGKLHLHVLFTHMHLDHIMGFPFFAPLFAPKDRLSVLLSLHGGCAWQNDLETVLSATLSAPLFPIGLDKIRYEAATIEYHPVYDNLVRYLGPNNEVRLTARRLHHPNETYGYRIEYGGKVFVVATDTEPYAGPDRALSGLAKDADVLYVDSQYDWTQYIGDTDGVSRLGWGHGYAEWCGRYAREAGVKMVVAGHHDPGAGNDRIHEVVSQLRAEHPMAVAAYDGLEVHIEDGVIRADDGLGDGRELVVERSPQN